MTIDITEIRHNTAEALKNNLPFTNALFKIENSLYEASKLGKRSIHVSFTNDQFGPPSGSSWEVSSQYKIAQHLESLGFKINLDRSPSYGGCAIASGFVVGIYVSW